MSAPSGSVIQNVIMKQRVTTAGRVYTNTASNSDTVDSMKNSVGYSKAPETTNTTQTARVPNR